MTTDTAAKLFAPGSLILLVGPPAAGKSTLADALVAIGEVDPGDVLSTDRYRHELAGDASDTSADRRMWVRLRSDLLERMAAGATTVVDATNLFPRRRARHMRVAKEHHRPVVAVLFDVGIEDLIARNSARDRSVPVGALVGMAEHMAHMVDDGLLVVEGVDEIIEAKDLWRRIAQQPGGRSIGAPVGRNWSMSDQDMHDGPGPDHTDAAQAEDIASTEERVAEEAGVPELAHEERERDVELGSALAPPD